MYGEVQLGVSPGKCILEAGVEVWALADLPLPRGVLGKERVQLGHGVGVEFVGAGLGAARVGEGVDQGL